jgi:hypothetical protein
MVEVVKGALAKGQLDGITLGVLLQLPVEVAFLDPLERVREVKLHYWTGPAGAVRPPSPKETPAADEAATPSVAMSYRQGIAKQDVVLPPLPPGQVYWLRAEFVDQDSLRQWGPAAPYQPTGAPPLERVPANLVVDVACREHGVLATAVVAFVQAAFQATLAVGQLSPYDRVHSKLLHGSA